MSAGDIAASKPAEAVREDWLAVLLVALWGLGAALSGVLGIWLALGTTAVLLGLAALLADRDPLRRLLGRSSPSAKSPALAGLLVGLGMTAATYTLYAPLTAAFPAVGADLRRLYLAFGAPALWRASLALPVVIVGEELVWRGVVHSALTRRLGPAAAVGAGSLLYFLAHAPVGSPALALACLGCGVCWAGLRAWTNSLVAVILAHLIWDFALLVVYPVVR